MSSRSWLIVAWAGFGVLFIGVALWLAIAGDSIRADMAARQPKAVISVTGGAMAPTPNITAPEKGEPFDPGRRVDEPSPPESEKATAPKEDEPLLREAVKKAKLQLHPHPDPLLIEKTPIGALPVIGKDGREPWKVYSRPFSVLDKRPRIALVFTQLGVSASATEAVIQNVPGSVSLAFAPYARRLKDWIDISRAAGHEVLVGLPMEPLDYPLNDPGPYTLLTTLPEEQNKRRIHWVLSRLTGYIGVSTFMASKFTAKPDALEPVIKELKARGLMMLDVRENPLSVARRLGDQMQMPVIVRDLFIDDTLSRKAIRAQLAEAEKIAKERGTAVAVARPYPVTVTEVERWSKELGKRGFVLTPISAVAEAAVQP